MRNHLATRALACTSTGTIVRDISVAEYATKYLRNGLAPLPLPFKSKAPTILNWTAFRVSEASIAEHFGSTEQNISLILGDASGGLVDVDIDNPVALAIADLFLPPTGMITGRCSSPRSHRFYRAINTDGGKKNFAHSVPARLLEMTGLSGQRGCLIELRSDGKQTLVPPSVHPGGERLCFYESELPADAEWEELRVAVDRIAAATLFALAWPHGGRHTAALGLAGWLCKDGWSENDCRTFIEAVCIGAADDELNDRLECVRTTYEAARAGRDTAGWSSLIETFGSDLPDFASRVLRMKKPSTILTVTRTATLPMPVNDNGMEFTDTGNADRLVKMFGDRLRYHSRAGKWLVYNGTHWVFDDAYQHIEFAKDVARSFYSDAAQPQNGGRYNQLAQHAKRSLNTNALEQMCRNARGLLALDPKELDRDKFLLCCRNGTIDLRTGTLRPHRASDMITRRIDVEYHPGAVCPTFDAFMAKIFMDKAEVVEFVLRLFGYALTGDTREQSLFIFHGTGANGKSTLVQIMTHVLGPYAQQMPMTSLMTTRNQSASNDLARLDGARLVIASETERRHQLAESLVKQLTGGNTMTARYLHQEFFEFVPQAKIVMETNHKPEIQGTDHGIWRRVKLVPFDVTIPPEERDNTLPDKLRAEASGILARLVRACLDWQVDGLTAPDAVQYATKSYQEEQDVVGRFLADQTVSDENGQITKKDLHELFVGWCHEDGVTALEMNAFGKELKARNFAEGKTKHARFWKGIALKDDFADPVD